ncbi:hypothetical protein R84981_002770 [Carnimonas sp. R-84981]|uniref:hypothetical protein n=1 Tax=Carnimonas bestiolae TaxID=3402172 RepID=UPI003EDC212B
MAVKTGSRDRVQSLLGRAFDRSNLLQDAVEDFVAIRTTNGTYDPVTGNVSPSNEEFTGRWARTSFSLKDRETLDIQGTDIKRVILQNESDWHPRINDRVGSYRVIQAWQDGFKASWTVQLREN